jgi:carbon monoxide dehydrogenase subunit G
LADVRPVIVGTDVPQPREDVYEFLDVLANHEQFTNHVLVEWHYSGAASGVGAKARVKVKAAGRSEYVDFEVISAERPSTIVERNVGAKGKRIATGTYTLADLPGGGTRVTFEYAWQQAPLSERVAAPLVRGVLHRANQRAMERLGEQLTQRVSRSGVTP